jgi:5-methylcytosine-specific restriction endonuclease McrA
MRGKDDGLYLCEKCHKRKGFSSYALRPSGKRMRYCLLCQESIKAQRDEKRRFVLSPECADLRRKKAILVTLGQHNRRGMSDIKAESLMRRADKKAARKGNKVYMRWLRSVETAHLKELGSTEEQKAKARRYYSEHKSAKIAYSKDRYYKNIESERHRVVLYKHSHPEKVARWDDKRKQLAADYSDGSLSHDICGKMFASAKRCPYCERALNPSNKTLDHIVPLSRGGAHGIHNTLICCRPCNVRKKAMDFSEWISTLSESCERRARKIYRERYRADPKQSTLALKYG